jgi:predicted amidohydrolase YtcJ
MKHRNLLIFLPEKQTVSPKEMIMNEQVTVYLAKKIITMYPEQPFTRAVAVKDGRILAIGEPEDVMSWLTKSPFTPHQVETAFQDKILMPGIVDAHTHVELQALIYTGHFVAQIPWPRPEGGFYPVYPTKANVIQRLKTIDKTLPPEEPLYAVAYDENKAGGFLHINELDAVSMERPILVSNLVFHRFWVNSALLQKAGISEDNLPPGIESDASGKPNGTLIEAKGLMSILPALPDLMNITEEKIRNILPLFTKGGYTTVCDAAVGALGLQKSLATFRNLLSAPETGIRVIAFPWAKTGVVEAGSLVKFIELVKKAGEDNTETLRIGPVKLYTDGSIISHTSPIGWPGYWDGSPEGHMENDPEEIREMLIRCHEAGLSTVTHANSRPGCQIVLDAVKAAQTIKYRPDMRHRIDHAYNITSSQLQLAKALGVTVQFFTPQIYYYGDAHLKIQGPDRAHHMTPTGTAKRLGVSWGFHNDPPGTPQLPWIGAWATVYRMTCDSGTVLGPDQRVTVEDVLRAMTIEAAYQLHLDQEIGSIEFGKRADFCVLEADPLEMDPAELKEIPVWGTLFSGKPHPAQAN